MSSKYFVAADERLWQSKRERTALISAIDGSLKFLRTSRAAATYNSHFAAQGITRTRVRRSLLRFRHLLATARSTVQLQAALDRKFALVRLAPRTHFTGYYEPVFATSHTRSSLYRYPLFRVPALPQPHPTRLQLEGTDGLHIAPILRGRDLVWLRDHLEAYLVQVEGSARLRLPNGRLMTVSYAAHTNWPYSSMGRELVKDDVMRFEELTQPAMISYFRQQPRQFDRYLPRNRRFVFFRETRGNEVSGSLGARLTPERSIATDPRFVPPGALSLSRITLHNPVAAKVFHRSTLTRFVLSQDAGGAIKGAGRVDLFTGTGTHAEQRASVINSMGQLDVLLLKS